MMLWRNRILVDDMGVPTHSNNMKTTSNPDCLFENFRKCNVNLRIFLEATVCYNKVNLVQDMFRKKYWENMRKHPTVYPLSLIG